MDLALNNIQRLICHKTQPTNQPTHFFSLVNKVKWFQELQCITNNSIKHLSFIYTQLDVKIVLFQTIQFNISTQFSSI